MDALPIRKTQVVERRLRLTAPLTVASGAIEERTILLLMVTGERSRGVGEAAPLEHSGTEDLASCRQALEVWTRERTLPDPATTPAAAAAVDLALLDLRGRIEGAALSDLLGCSPTGVGVNALLAGGDPAAVRAQAQLAVAEGFRTLKLKVGQDIDLAVEQLRAIREVAPDAALRLDANGCWTVEAAIVALARLAPFGVALVEQPVAAGPGDIERLWRLRATSPIPLAADESASSQERVAELAAARAVDAVVLKPMRLGGVSRALAAARSAQVAGLPTIVTSHLGSAVERAGALHLAAAVDVGNPEPQDHGLGTGSLLEKDVAPAETVRNGRLLPHGPGHGVAVRR